MSCTCDTCKRAVEVQQRLAKLPESERAFWESLFLQLEMVEIENGINEAIISNDWPNADKLIERASKK